MINDLYVAEYSANQDSFHTDLLFDVLQMNRNNALRKRSNDYEILGIFETAVEADEFIRLFRERQAEREVTNENGT